MAERASCETVDPEGIEKHTLTTTIFNENNFLQYVILQLTNNKYQESNRLLKW